MRWLRGVTREVFLIGRWAIKVPSFRSWRLFLTGFLCNMQEREWSKTGDVRLCPVRYSCPGGLWVVMDRCDPISDDELAAAIPVIDGLPVEPKSCSFGRHPSGRIVAVDYG